MDCCKKCINFGCNAAGTERTTTDCEDYMSHLPTNADSIRAMTDDMQLAIFFASVSGCPYDREVALDKCESWSNACVSCWHDWLKQEVAE